MRRWLLKDSMCSWLESQEERDTPSPPSVLDPAALGDVSLSDVPVFCLCGS